MEINIFDVEHGFCSYIIADNGNVILIDCGHNEKTGFRPSNYLPMHDCKGIERLIISNYDEDHLSDLPNLVSALPIQILHRNKTITGDELRRLKLRTGAIQPGMAALLNMIKTYSVDESQLIPPSFPEIDLKFYRNPYPTFDDTNNLSLVTILHYRSIHIIFPGDLEKAGWEALLKYSDFQEQLKMINIFVASHHGRKGGYCEEVFNKYYCFPDVIIISDESIKYDTQEEVDYSKHAKGIQWDDGKYKYVLTTRKNGMIKIFEKPGYNYYIHTTK